LVFPSTLEHRAGSKKSKKSKQPLAPSSLLPGWDRDKSWSKTTPAAAKNAVVSPADDSMVQYGGILDDKEDDKIERVAVLKNTIDSKGGVGKKSLVRQKISLGS
jgi:hypothetical protein